MDAKIFICRENINSFGHLKIKQYIKIEQLELLPVILV